jgi:hypothetical protein
MKVQKFLLLSMMLFAIVQLDAQNLVQNPGFETGTSPWSIWGGGSVVNNNAHTGIYALKSTSTGGAELVVTGLTPGTNYTFKGYAKSVNGAALIGVKNHGNTAVSSSTTSTSYTQLTVNFTTGLSSTSAKLYAYFDPSSGEAYFDDFELVIKNVQTITSSGNTNYYVDAVNGNDSNDGKSEVNAWKSLDIVNSVIFAPGDTLYFKSGDIWTGQLSLKGSGSSASPIVIDQYGVGDKPLIQAQGQYDSALFVKNESYWEINNLQLTNWLATGQNNNGPKGVYLLSENNGVTNHIHLKGLHIHDINGNNVKKSNEGFGILFSATGQTISNFNDILIENCQINKVDRNGIVSMGYSSRDNWHPHTNVVIRNNVLDDIGGDGIIVIACDSALVEHNALTHARARETTTASAGIWPWSSDNTTFQYNEAAYTGGGRDGQGFDADSNCKNTLFQYNYSHDNGGGFALIINYTITAPGDVEETMDNAVFRYNISQNDGTVDNRVIQCTGAYTNCKIYNNVFYNSSNFTDVKLFLYGTWPDGYPINQEVTNNIFYIENGGSAQITNDGPGTVFNNNVFFGNISLGAIVNNNPIYTDPQFVNRGTGGDGINTVDGYKLLSGSPALNAGIVIANNGGIDYWGNNVSASISPNIGAYSEVGVTGTPAGSNLIVDPGFENNSSAWNVGWNASIEASNAHTGTNSVRIGKTSSQNGSAEQIITGLLPNTRYTLSGWLKADAGASVIIGVKNFGAAQITSTNTTAIAYEQKSITFTTGASNTSATIFVFRNTGTGYGYGDDLSLTISVAYNKSLGVKDP